MTDQLFDPTEFRAPHCNEQVLHAPGICIYCDHYPARQEARAKGGLPFTPPEANGWSGNRAVSGTKPHYHLGADVSGDNSVRCSSVNGGYQCEGRIYPGQTKHTGFHHFGAARWAPEGWTPPEVKRQDNRFVRWFAEKMGF
jgi:hypothetical protein